MSTARLADRRGVRLALFALAIGGVALRVGLAMLSPRFAYLSDHDDFVRWGIQAADGGVLSLYDRPPPRWNIRVPTPDGFAIQQRELDRLCNYPPLAAYVLRACGGVFGALRADRLINTVESRLVFVAPTILADLLLAWGCAATVAMFRRGRAPLVAFAVATFLPPLAWDSAVWGQVDTWALAAAVWMLRAMLLQKWLAAGLLLGVMAGLKTQAVLVLPLWAVAVVWARPRWMPLAGGAAAAATLAAVATPFMVHGGLAWLRASYTENLAAYSGTTTLKAFNLWYLDGLLCDSLDEDATWLGVSKAAWGRRILLPAGLAAALGAAAWRLRRDARGPVVCAAVTLLVSVMLPTQVHERYLLLTLPFLLVAALWWPRFWAPLALLSVVCMSQVTWPIWMRTPLGAWEAQYRPMLQRVAAGRTDLPPGVAARMQEDRRRYDQGRARTIAFEWANVVLALLGCAAMAWAVLTAEARPDSSDAYLAAAAGGSCAGAT